MSKLSTTAGLSRLACGAASVALAETTRFDTDGVGAIAAK